MTIVPAGAAHVAVLEALHGQCFGEGWTAEDFGRLLGTPGTSALIALDGAGADPVGLALSRVAADECELLTIGVVPASRCRRHGRALLGASLAAAREGGAVRYFLDVAEDNLPAVRLYYSVGFTQVGRRPNYYRRAGAGVAALVLALDLQRGEESGEQSGDAGRGEGGRR